MSSWTEGSEWSVAQTIKSELEAPGTMEESGIASMHTLPASLPRQEFPDDQSPNP